MQFFSWHYTKGIEFYFQGWRSAFGMVIRYFSPSLLLKTLFAPWKRLVVYDKTAGFSFQKAFEVLTYNLVSRGVGVAVRLILLGVGVILLVLTFLAGAMGLIFWLVFPFFGYGVYRKYTNQPKQFVENLIVEVGETSEPLKVIFESEAGVFVLDRVGVKLSSVVGSANTSKVNLKGVRPKSFQDIIEKLVKDEVWKSEFFNKEGISRDDLVLAASWWDKKRGNDTQIGKGKFGRPGIALELTFGYTPTLNKYSIDLSTPQPFSHRLIGRQKVVSRMERVLSSGYSVLLTGQAGVGKRTVVLEFAHRAISGRLGPKMAYKRVLELDYNSLLSEASDVNLKKTKFAEILAEAAYAGNVILMIRDIQRITNVEVEDYDFTDVFEEHLDKKDLKIIAVSTGVDYERFIAPNMKLGKYMKRVEVTQPTNQEAMQILVESAQQWEDQKALTITVPVLRFILEESDKYVTEVPFPEKALEILDEVVVHCEQKKIGVVKVKHAKLILSEKIGVSFAKMTRDEKARLQDLEKVIHERLINQGSAVDLIAKTLRAKATGVVKENKPIGSFLFLGPTGVGKTETAKVLAKVYYGSQESVLRYDMAEYSGSEGLERLIGSVSNNLPGALTSAIKNKPASLLLLDEIEKARSDIYNLFLSLLDEGVITDAFGKKVICRHLFVIGTSNAGAEYIRQLVKKGTRGAELQESVVNHVLSEQIFSPEFLNRFDGVVVYEPLKEEDLVKIAHLMLSDLAENLKKKNIYMEVTDECAQKLAVDGFDPTFGARPMRRMVNLTIGDLIGNAILTGDIVGGDRFKVIPGEKKGEFVFQVI